MDLFLDQNGPNVGLDSSSTLRLEKLAYEKTSLGTKIDTLLDLKQGALYGSVKKLIAASRYEVKMPKGIAHVRGTEFYIDEKQGTVVVTAGSVNVSVTLTTSTGSEGIAVAGLGFDSAGRIVTRAHSDCRTICRRGSRRV